MTNLSDDQFNAFRRDDHEMEQRGNSYTRGYSGSARPRNLGPVQNSQAEGLKEPVAPFPVNHYDLKGFLLPAIQQHDLKWKRFEHGLRGSLNIHEDDASGRFHNALAQMAHLHANDPATFKHAMDSIHQWHADNPQGFQRRRKQANQEWNLDASTRWGTNVENRGEQRAPVNRNFIPGKDDMRAQGADRAEAKAAQRKLKEENPQEYNRQEQIKMSARRKAQGKRPS